MAAGVLCLQDGDGRHELGLGHDLGADVVDLLLDCRSLRVCLVLVGLGLRRPLALLRALGPDEVASLLGGPP